MACAAVEAVIDVIESESLLANVRQCPRTSARIAWSGR